MRNPRICFEDALNDCITAIQEQGNTVEECLAQYPNLREELEPLLRLTVRLQMAPTLKAPPELRRVSSARVRNLVAARPHQVERPVAIPSSLHSLHRRLRSRFHTYKKRPVAITISLVLALWLLIGAGLAHASTDALPGDALYPVKRAVENVQLAGSLDDASDARLHLTFATRRLDEISALLEKGRPQDIGSALEDYKAHVEPIPSLLTSGSHLSADEQATLAELLVTAQAHHEAQFSTLLDQVPDQARPATELALTTSRAIRDRALQVLGGGPSVLPEVTPPSPIKTPTPIPLPTQAPTQAPTPIPPPTQLPSQIPTPTALPTRSPAQPPTPTLLPTQPPAQSPIPTLCPTQPPVDPPTQIPMPTLPPAPTSSPEPPMWPTLHPTPELPTPPTWPTPPAWPTPPELPTSPAWPTPPELPTSPAWPTPPASPTPP